MPVPSTIADVSPFSANGALMLVNKLDEVYEWEQMKSQGLLIDVQHASLGKVTLPGPSLRFFDASGSETTQREHAAPPLLDEHGDGLRTWLEAGPA